MDSTRPEANLKNAYPSPGHCIIHQKSSAETASQPRAAVKTLRDGRVVPSLQQNTQPVTFRMFFIIIRQFFCWTKPTSLASN
jgi:hypothetical protein